LKLVKPNNGVVHLKQNPQKRCSKLLNFKFLWTLSKLLKFKVAKGV